MTNYQNAVLLSMSIHVLIEKLFQLRCPDEKVNKYLNQLSDAQLYLDSALAEMCSRLPLDEIVSMYQPLSKTDK